MIRRPIIVLIVLLFSVTSFLLGKCSGSGDADSGQPMSNAVIDSLERKCRSLEWSKQSVLANLETAQLHIDSLKASKTVYLTRYTTIKEKRSEIARDTSRCLELFDQLTAACDSLNSVNDSIISSHEYRDSSLLHVISIQHDQMGIKDSIIGIQSASLDKQVMQVENLHKKVRRNRVIAGISSAVAVVLAVFK